MLEVAGRRDKAGGTSWVLGMGQSNTCLLATLSAMWFLG